MCVCTFVYKVWIETIHGLPGANLGLELCITIFRDWLHNPWLAPKVVCKNWIKLDSSRLNLEKGEWGHIDWRSCRHFLLIVYYSTNTQDAFIAGIIPDRMDFISLARLLLGTLHPTFLASNASQWAIIQVGCKVPRRSWAKEMNSFYLDRFQQWPCPVCCAL